MWLLLLLLLPLLLLLLLLWCGFGGAYDSSFARVENAGKVEALNPTSASRCGGGAIVCGTPPKIGC